MSDKLDSMRHAGQVNLAAINYAFDLAKPGVTLKELDEQIELYIRKSGCLPAFKGYQPEGYPVVYKNSSCISVNHAAVHGVPNEYILQAGDLVTIDLGTEHQGWFVDAARARIIPGKPFKKAKLLLEATNAILNAQLSVIKNECTFLSMINAAEKTASQWGVKICPMFGGHSIGNKIHLPPFIPNIIDNRKSKIQQQIEYNREKFIAGETYCIEPVVMLTSVETYICDDGWTVYTKNGDLACHSERCLLVTEEGYEILT